MSFLRINRLGFRSRRRQRKSIAAESLECRTLLSTFYVDGDFQGEGDGSEQAPFNSVYDGIDAALRSPGDDTVVLQPRANVIYPDPIAIAQGYSAQQVRGFDVFDGNLTIRGGGDSPEDVVVRPLQASGIYVDAPIDVTIENLTVTGGSSAGITNRSSQSLTVDNVHIVDLGSRSGIVHQGQDLTVRNSLLEGNYQGLWMGTGNTNYVPDHLTVENTVSRNNRFHGFIVQNSTGTLEFDGASASGNSFAGIRVNNSEFLQIDGGSFSDNGRNGIVSNLVLQTVIDGPVVEDNGSVDFEYYPGGGGIHIRPGSAIPVQISNTTVRGNQNWGNGGGIEVWAPQQDFVVDVMISNSIVENNSVRDTPTSGTPGIGGGIAINGTANLQLTDSVIAGNTARIGGGVYFGQQFVRSLNPISLEIDGTTISDNTAWNGGGGVHQFNGTTTITDSTISANIGNSGGLQMVTSGGRMTNVTVSGNRGVRGGVGITSRNEFLISNSTITENVGSRYGGIFSQSTPTTLVNTIVADNGTNSLLEEVIDLPADTADDLTGWFTSLGHNLFGEAEGAEIISDVTGSGPHTTDQFGTVANPLDPVLGPLSDNGGSTLTHLPLSGSLAIDAGDASAAPASDQRGIGRPQRAGVEIGAVEVENNAPIVAATSAVVLADEGTDALQTGTFGDLDGDTVTLSASAGNVTPNADGTWSWSLGVDDGPVDSASITVTAEDQFGATSTVSFDVVVSNVAPTAGIDGPASAIKNEAIEIALSATDPSAADMAAGFTYEIDWDSDGIVDATVNGGALTKVTHSFASAGNQSVTVTATDKDGGTSNSVTYEVEVSQPLTLSHDSAISLNSADKGNKTFEVIIQTTADFEASTVDLSTVFWAGAGVYRSQYRDIDKDGDRDLILKFRLSDTDLLDRYRSALQADSTTTRQPFNIELTGRTASGSDLFGTTEIDLFMTGKKLRDFLDAL